MLCLLTRERRFEGLDGFDFEAYFQASIQAYLADTAAVLRFAKEFLILFSLVMRT